MKQSKGLSEDYGGKYKQVEDAEDFYLTAKYEYGLNTDKFWNAHTEYKTFVKSNSKSITTGRKIVEKYGP